MKLRKMISGNTHKHRSIRLIPKHLQYYKTTQPHIPAVLNIKGSATAEPTVIFTD